MILRPPSSTLSHYTTLFHFFFNATPTTEIYTLSLHDALPIYRRPRPFPLCRMLGAFVKGHHNIGAQRDRSEEHTSELQSRLHLVCRLLLEKKKIVSFSVLFPIQIIRLSVGTT